MPREVNKATVRDWLRSGPTGLNPSSKLGVTCSTWHEAHEAHEAHEIKCFRKATPSSQKDIGTWLVWSCQKPQTPHWHPLKRDSGLSSWQSPRHEHRIRGVHNTAQPEVYAANERRIGWITTSSNLWDSLKYAVMHPCVTYGALMCFMQVHVYVTYILYYVFVSFCYCYIQVCLYVYYMSIIYKIYVMLCLFSVYHMSIVYNRMFMQVHVYINMFYYIIIYVWCYVFLLLLDTEYAWIQLRGARWSWVSWNHWTMTRLSWAKAYKEREMVQPKTAKVKKICSTWHLALCQAMSSYSCSFSIFSQSYLLWSFDPSTSFNSTAWSFVYLFFASAFDEDLSCTLWLLHLLALYKVRQEMPQSWDLWSSTKWPNQGKKLRRPLPTPHFSQMHKGTASPALWPQPSLKIKLCLKSLYFCFSKQISTGFVILWSTEPYRAILSHTEPY